MSTKNYSVFKSMFMPLVNELKMDYWCTHTGVDGYMYLLFQRRFLRLTVYMGVISVCAQYASYLNDKNYAFHFMGEQEDQEEKLKNFDVDLLNSENSPINIAKAGDHLQNNINMLHNLFSHADTEHALATHRAWISIFIVFTFSLLTIRITQKTRRDAKVAYESYHHDMSRYRDHECLKTRTLHVKGVLPDDRTGNGIEQHLNKILA